jgi:hypothetical protein
MLLAVVPVAITLLAKIGKIVPAGTEARVTAAVSLQATTATLPAEPTYKARTPTNSVLLLGVTADSLYAENIAPGLEGVKSGINHLQNKGGRAPL